MSVSTAPGGDLIPCRSKVCHSGPAPGCRRPPSTPAAARAPWRPVLHRGDHGPRLPDAGRLAPPGVMVVETIVVAALHGAYGGLTWVACANSRGVAVFLVLWPMAYGRGAASSCLYRARAGALRPGTRGARPDPLRRVSRSTPWAWNGGPWEETTCRRVGARARGLRHLARGVAGCPVAGPRAGRTPVGPRHGRRLGDRRRRVVRVPGRLPGPGHVRPCAAGRRRRVGALLGPAPRDGRAWSAVVRGPAVRLRHAVHCPRAGRAPGDCRPRAPRRARVRARGPACPARAQPGAGAAVREAPARPCGRPH